MHGMYAWNDLGTPTWIPLPSELDVLITARKSHLLAYFRHLLKVQLEDLSVHYNLFLMITHAEQP